MRERLRETCCSVCWRFFPAREQKTLWRENFIEYPLTVCPSCYVAKTPGDLERPMDKIVGGS